MEARGNSEPRIPVICLDPSAPGAFGVFNPNDWEKDSKAVVLSCSTEFSVLQYGATRIAEMCRSPKDRCQIHFETLKSQWETSTWDLAELIYYAQAPGLHVLIEAFFSGLKSLLDLIVQLLSTEEIVSVKLHGFHRVKSLYGGTVLNALDNNVSASKKHIARSLKDLIGEHKRLWIDEVIKSRDLLVHPTRGIHQLMFEIQLENRDGTLVYKDALPPCVGRQTISDYSAARIESMKQFAQVFLAALR